MAHRERLRRDRTQIPVEIWSRRLDLPTGPIGLSVVRDISAQLEADQIREEVLTAISRPAQPAELDQAPCAVAAAIGAAGRDAGPTAAR